MRKSIQAAAVLVALLGAGCLVEIRRVSDPRPAFQEAREEARRLQGKPGPAHAVNVLVYEPDEHKLVRVSVPMWLVKKIKHDVDDGDIDWDDDDDTGRAGRRARRHLRIEELEKAGLGVLVEVEDDDGGQVLVWLK
jgi:hypothetical protein